MSSELFAKPFYIPQVQDGVFGHGCLTKSDLACCARVSKRWKTMVIPFLWQALNGTKEQMKLVSKQGLIANGEWIRDLTLYRWEIVDWLLETQACERLLQLEVKLPLQSSAMLLPLHSSMSREAGSLKLATFIERHPGLKRFLCQSKRSYTAIFDQSVTKALSDHCGPLLLSLELFSLNLNRSNLVGVLIHCLNLQELTIQNCSFTETYLDELEGHQLPNLRQLKFYSNVVYTSNAQESVQFARGQDWLRLLRVAKGNPSKLQRLEILSKVLTPNEFEELVHIHGFTLMNLKELILFDVLGTESEVVQLLRMIVQPLQVLCLSGAFLIDELVEVVKSKHQATLLEFAFRGLQNGRHYRGLLNNLELQRLKILTLNFAAVSFETFVPYLYIEQGGNSVGQGEQDAVTEQKDNLVLVGDGGAVGDDDGSTPVSTVDRMLISAEQQHQQEQRYDYPSDWTCREVETLTITFQFDRELEFVVLVGSYPRTIRSPEELFVKGFLFLMGEISQLPRLRQLSISVSCAHNLDHSAVDWENLDGCWTWLTACSELWWFELEWPVPGWLNDKYELWQKATFGEK